jgi:MarR family transcriptional regulator, lower aerobic nicotinate degradation pathway regulator
VSVQAHQVPEQVRVGLPTQIAALAAVSRRLFKERMKTEQWVIDAGLRAPSYAVLICVDRLGPISQKRVADEIATDPSDLVAVIDILERAGFVGRERDTDDRRRYSLTLTPAGRTALARLDEVAAEVQAETLAPLDAGEREMFEQLVRRVLAHHVGAMRSATEAS